MTNFEECKKVFIKYLEKQITEQELKAWASAHCSHCKDMACHCNECPMFINEDCKFPQ